MKPVVPYLRVLAGLFAGVTLWLAIVEIIHGNVAESLIQLLFFVGLGYLAIGKPLRDRHARVEADRAALAARAEAGHQAFLAGDRSAAFAPPPEPPTPPKMRRGVVIAALVAAAFVLIGIIGDISDGLDAPSGNDATTTPQTSARVTPGSTPPAPSATSAAATVPVVTSAPAAVSTTTANAAAAGTSAVMPDVECMDLQTAQDTIQAAGVFYSRSVDATGEGRMQVQARNWIVVGQQPSAGAVVGEGEALLSVVKEVEFAGCR